MRPQKPELGPFAAPIVSGVAGSALGATAASGRAQENAEGIGVVNSIGKETASTSRASTGGETTRPARSDFAIESHLP